MKMELSIIVPVYNGEKYILNCLNSIYCQVLPKFEVIIVNDGSDEICLDIIKKFVSCHAECILINSVINEGVSKARNHALEIAKGKYIMFLDADDSWKDNKVREIINIATNYDLVLWAFDITYKTKILGTKVESPTLVSKKIYYKKLFKPETQYLYSVLWNKVFRGDIIRKYRIRFRNDIKICEDWTFILDYLDCIDSIYISDCNFYQYSQDNFNSLVKKKRIRRENWYSLFEVFKEIRRHYLKNNAWSENEELIYVFMLNPIIKESIEIVCFEKNVNKQLEIFLSEEQIIKIVSVVKGRNIYERIFLQLCKRKRWAVLVTFLKIKWIRSKEYKDDYKYLKVIKLG